MDIRSEIESWFPNIVGKDFKIVKTNGDFNCVAFSLDGTNLFLQLLLSFCFSFVLLVLFAQYN